MRKTNLRKSNGITLIALVITIIVLLILAGVAISMLSGENGILKKAAEAKTKTEEGQKQEETALLSMELETHFQTTNSQYKCSNGFITGIEVESKVEQLQSALPEGYTVKAEDETDNFTYKDPTDGKAFVTTGLAIQKNNETIARTVIYGDVDCSDGIGTPDKNMILNFLGGLKIAKDYQKLAADVNHDGIVNAQDCECINKHMTDSNTIDQKIYAVNPKDIIIETDEYILKKCIQTFNQNEENSKYKIEYDKDDDSYVLKGASSSDKVEDILKYFKDEKMIMSDSDGKQLASTDLVGEEYLIDWVLTGQFSRHVSICWITLK